VAKLTSIEDLKELQERAKQDRSLRSGAGTRIIVGMGTCGIAAGARETMNAILEELERTHTDARVTTVGCIGMCSMEPLVDIEEAGKLRVTYRNVHPDMVPRLIDQHLRRGNVVQEWAMGRVPSEGIGQG
jgi:NADP-reducing hydrogenase subunit HndB